MSLYEKIDGTLMNGANIAVRAWNWTTGRTKTDLANILFTTGMVCISTGSERSVKYAGLLVAPIAIVANFLVTKRNRRIEELEMGYRDSNAIPIELFEEEKYQKGSGYFFIGLSSLNSYQYFNENRGDELNSLGSSITGASFFIMRAEDTPKRKDCVRCGIDKLSEMVRSYSQRPRLQPKTT